jgi:hypothetical protein
MHICPPARRGPRPPVTMPRADGPDATGTGAHCPARLGAVGPSHAQSVRALPSAPTGPVRTRAAPAELDRNLKTWAGKLLRMSTRILAVHLRQRAGSELQVRPATCQARACAAPAELGRNLKTWAGELLRMSTRILAVHLRQRTGSELQVQSPRRQARARAAHPSRAGRTGPGHENMHRHAIRMQGRYSGSASKHTDRRGLFPCTILPARPRPAAARAPGPARGRRD